MRPVLRRKSRAVKICVKVNETFSIYIAGKDVVKIFFKKNPLKAEIS